MNNYHMNNLANGVGGGGNGGFPNNYDAKYSMPSIPPPGFQQGNSNNGKKAECIN
jgi:hypothetical protein